MSQLMKHKTPDLRDLGRRDLLRQQAGGYKMFSGTTKLAQVCREVAFAKWVEAGQNFVTKPAVFLEQMGNQSRTERCDWRQHPNRTDSRHTGHQAEVMIDSLAKDG